MRGKRNAYRDSAEHLKETRVFEEPGTEKNSIKMYLKATAYYGIK
jgi:hypothetical protein